MTSISIKRLGKYSASNWQIYSIGVPGAPDSEPFELASEKFVCLLCTHEHLFPVDDLENIVERLLRLGCVHFCCWGKNSAVTRNIINRIISGEGKENVAWLDIITTVQANTPLKESVDFFLDQARPAERYASTCNSAVAITIGEEIEVMQVELTIAMKLINPIGQEKIS